MASGVAMTRLEKLHFTNWLNWNCESSVCVQELSHWMGHDPVPNWQRGVELVERTNAVAGRQHLEKHVGDRNGVSTMVSQLAAGICEFHYQFHVHDSLGWRFCLQSWMKLDAFKKTRISLVNLSKHMTRLS